MNKAYIVVLFLILTINVKSQIDTLFSGWSKEIILALWPKESTDLFWYPEYSNSQITWRAIKKTKDTNYNKLVNIRVFGEDITIETIDSIRYFRAETVRLRNFKDSLLTAKRIEDSLLTNSRFTFIPQLNPRLAIEPYTTIQKNIKKTKSKKKPKVQYNKFNTSKSKGKPDKRYYYIVSVDIQIDTKVFLRHEAFAMYIMKEITRQQAHK